jgi:uncharacterized Fe-S cluster protein YjdI
MPKTTHKYTNGEVTIVWKPDICIHSAICFKGLGDVFNPTKKPWIDPSGATTEAIVEQVRKCPSGALSYFMNEEVAGAKEIKAEAAQMLNIEIVPAGPILIKTECTIEHSNGQVEMKQGITALCRCGGSNNKPYCDGSHRKNGFTD